MLTPDTRWKPSPRPYNPNPPAWLCPEVAWTLKVDNHGTIDIHDHPWRIANCSKGL